jgi:branched-chain amino acid transport system permease protein
LALYQAVLNGLLIGGVYALISIGLTLVFGVMDVINFAQGEFLMIGMFAAYFINRFLGVDPLVSAVAVGAIVFLIGVVVERVIVEPIIQAPPLAQVFATVGLSIVLQNAAAAAFGSEFHGVNTPYQTASLPLPGAHLPLPYVLAFAYATLVAVLLYAFLNLTDLGRAMRATAQNRTAATLMGINPRTMYMIAFGLGVGLAGLAGAVVLPYTVVHPAIGTQYVLIMYTVVVLGGLGSIRGAALAGLVIGVVQAVSTVFLATELQNLVVFLMFMGALILGAGGVIKSVRLGVSPLAGRRTVTAESVLAGEAEQAPPGD